MGGCQLGGGQQIEGSPASFIDVDRAGVAWLAFRTHQLGRVIERESAQRLALVEGHLRQKRGVLELAIGERAACASQALRRQSLRL